MRPRERERDRKIHGEKRAVEMLDSDVYVTGAMVRIVSLDRTGTWLEADQTTFTGRQTYTRTSRERHQFEEDTNI